MNKYLTTWLKDYMRNADPEVDLYVPLSGIDKVCPAYCTHSNREYDSVFGVDIFDPSSISCDFLGIY